MLAWLLVAAAPETTGPKFREVPYRDAVCGRVPDIPLTFSMPADFVSRSVGKTIEGGCLWGTKEDLDRATGVPEEGDFTTLERGIFRARMSTNVICNPETGVFDAMDGGGEDGIRRQLRDAGASIVIWKKERLGGLPALQIVAEVGPAGRVYMLYLGNTRTSSNTVLVNYYRPAVQTAADDETWSRFVQGIRSAATAGPPGGRSETPPALTPSPAPDRAAENREALERVQEFLRGRENEPAEKVFKNIELLRGKPAGRLPGMMNALTGLLGASCSTCHVPDNFASDELATKKTARRHFEMQARLNREYFGGANAIICSTCHRGHLKPPP